MLKKILLLSVLFNVASCQFSETENAVTKKNLPNLNQQKATKQAAIAVNFMETELEDALILAQKSKKLVFVDVYTKGCKPCKEMDKYVFSDSRVGAFFNENFVNYKLNARLPANNIKARRYGVNAYPTLIFMDENGESLLSSAGYIDAEMLLNYGKEVLADQKK